MGDRRRLLPLVAVLTALCAAPAAQASSTQASFFQDDRLLLSSDFAQQSRALDTLRFLGVDTIHTVVNWKRIAGTRKPANPADPASYPIGNWDPYDALVRGAAARGIAVLMSPAGPVPKWASACRRNTNQACRPKPAEYAKFVTALGRRYSGGYVDEDQEQTKLPRVTQWSIWNEPNLSSWLYPQTVKRHAVGAGIYRGLVYSGTAALRASGHGGDLILVGETAPIGGNSKNTAPADFLLQLFCVDNRGRKLGGRAAKDLGCRGARRIQAGGISHHPYARGAGVPTGTRQKPGSLTMGVIDRFVPLLRAARRSGVAPRRLGVYLTEFGVTTRPPDRKFGVSLSRQAQYINEIDYLAYRRPWIKSVSQFQLADDTGITKRTFQTGLMFSDGRAKQSLGAYRTPIFIVQKGRRVTIFGQARPGGSRTVLLQFKGRRGGYKTVLRKRTNSAGYLLVTRAAKKGLWRIAWTDSDGSTIFSRGSQSVPGSSPATPGVPPPGPGTPPPAPGPGGGPGTPPPTGGGGGGSVQYTLTVAVSKAGLTGDGTVSSNPAGISNCGPSGGTCAAPFNAGTAVTLTAAPRLNSTFSWGGACAGTTVDRCTVTMSQAQSVTVNFSSTP